MKFSKDKIYILDGATGTELQRRGVDTSLPPWSANGLFTHPQVIKQIHKDYIEAGADIITTNTFRTQRRTLKKIGQEHRTEEANKVAVDLAYEAKQEAKADRPIYIAASLTSLEDCYRPDLVPSRDDVLYDEFKEHAELLNKDDRIDFFLLETFHTIREILAAAKAVHSTGKPMAISLIINSKGNLLSGEMLEQVIDELNQYEPIAYLMNCMPPELSTVGLKKLMAVTDLPVGCYAQGDGEAGSELGWQFNSPSRLKEYTEYAKKWKDMGVNIIGGCCGTSPEYTKEYSKLRD